MSSLSPRPPIQMLQIAIKHLKVSLFVCFLRGVPFLCPWKMSFFSARFTTRASPQHKFGIVLKRSIPALWIFIANFWCHESEPMKCDWNSFWCKQINLTRADWQIRSARTKTVHNPDIHINKITVLWNIVVKYWKKSLIYLFSYRYLVLTRCVCQIRCY